jgi:hypothetical protein
MFRCGWSTVMWCWWWSCYQFEATQVRQIPCSIQQLANLRNTTWYCEAWKYEKVVEQIKFPKLPVIFESCSLVIQ